MSFFSLLLWVRKCLALLATVFIFVFWFVLFSPLLLIPHRKIGTLALLWGSQFYVFFIARCLFGVSLKIEGGDHKPPPPYIIASKHQSFFETLFLYYFFDQPLIILKKSLTSIPFFGWNLKKSGVIPIDRTQKISALKKIKTDIASFMQKKLGYILLFPEGTRTTPGQKTHYKSGIYTIYKMTNYPVLPIALNSGFSALAFGKNRYHHLITISLLEPIPAGLNKQDFMNLLEEKIEKKSAELAVPLKKTPKKNQ